MANIPSEEVLTRLQAQISSMSNEDLEPLLRQIAEKMGAGGRIIRTSNVNVDRLRQQIGAMSPRDIRQLASSVKPETLQTVLDQLGQSGLL